MPSTQDVLNTAKARVDELEAELGPKLTELERLKAFLAVMRGEEVAEAFRKATDRLAEPTPREEVVAPREEETAEVESEDPPRRRRTYRGRLTKPLRMKQALQIFVNHPDRPITSYDYDPEVMSHQVMGHTLRELDAEGWVEKEKKGRIYYFTLTDKGKQQAKRLALVKQKEKETRIKVGEGIVR